MPRLSVVTREQVLVAANRYVDQFLGECIEDGEIYFFTTIWPSPSSPRHVPVAMRLERPTLCPTPQEPGRKSVGKVLGLIRVEDFPGGHSFKVLEGSFTMGIEHKYPYPGILDLRAKEAERMEEWGREQ